MAEPTFIARSSTPVASFARHNDTILIVISDVYEGGDRAGMIARAKELVGSGVPMIALLALSDQGAPSFDAGTAGVLASLGVPCFACTPDAFPELMASAIRRADVAPGPPGRGLVSHAPVNDTGSSRSSRGAIAPQDDARGC